MGPPLHSNPHAVRLEPKERRGQCGVPSVLLPPTRPTNQGRDVTNVVPRPSILTASDMLLRPRSFFPKGFHVSVYLAACERGLCSARGKSRNCTSGHLAIRSLTSSMMRIVCLWSKIGSQCAGCFERVCLRQGTLEEACFRTFVSQQNSVFNQGPTSDLGEVWPRSSK